MEETSTCGGLVSSTVNGNTANTASAYEYTLLKLVQILRTKTSNSLKQLEELWDSLEPLETVDSDQSKASRTSPTSTSSSSSLTCFNENSNDSNNSDSSNSTLKRDASKMSSNQSSKQLAKKPRVDLAVNKPVSKTQKLNSKSTTTTTTTASTTRGDSSNDSHSSNSRQSGELEVKVEFPDMETSCDDIVDMLDFTCSICKNFNQEPSNRLIECRECTRLFHQQCHQPRIEHDELEPAGNGDEKQMSWYFSKCATCRTQTKDADEEVSRINSNGIKATTSATKISAVAVNKQTPSPMNGKSGGMKGLASLANKFAKPPSPEDLKKSKPSLSKVIESKPKPAANGMIKLGAPTPVKKVETKTLLLLNGKEKKANGLVAKPALSVTRSSKIT